MGDRDNRFERVESDEVNRPLHLSDTVRPPLSGRGRSRASRVGLGVVNKDWGYVPLWGGFRANVRSEREMSFLKT